MMLNFLDFIGFFNDNTFTHAQDFWSDPLGLFITGSICLCSALNIVHPGIDDNLFDRVWYSLLSIVMLVAFLVGLNPDTTPHHIVKSTMMLLSIRCIASVIQRHRHYKKTGTPQKTIGM